MNQSTVTVPPPESPTAQESRWGHLPTTSVAVVLSIIETCKLCGVDAEAYMADVTERLQNDSQASRWDELMSWDRVRRQATRLPHAAALGSSLALAFMPDPTLTLEPVSYTHLRAHETVLDLVCRLLLEKKKYATQIVTTKLSTLMFSDFVHENLPHTQHNR